MQDVVSGLLIANRADDERRFFNGVRLRVFLAEDDASTPRVDNTTSREEVVVVRDANHLRKSTKMLLRSLGSIRTMLDDTKA